jgi:hypothetical protein
VRDDSGLLKEMTGTWRVPLGFCCVPCFLLLLFTDPFTTSVQNQSIPMILLLTLLFCVWEFLFLDSLDPNPRPRSLASMFLSSLGLVVCVELPRVDLSCHQLKLRNSPAW